MSYGNKLIKLIYYRSPYLIKNFIATAYGWKTAKQRFGRYYKEYFQIAEKFTWSDNKSILEYQFNKLKKFLIFVSQHSLFYKQLFNSYGFDPYQIVSIEDLQVLPILSKEEFRKSINKILINDPTLCASISETSGTTGKGLRFLESLECYQRENAYRFHNYYTMGNIKVKDKWAFCAGHPVTYIKRTKPPFWVHDFYNNWLFFSSYHMTETNLKYYLDKLYDFKPDLLGGYPSSIYLLALANLNRKKPVSVKGVFTSSETLYPFQKKIIEESFNCLALSYYGNAERCGFISECPKGKFHIRIDHSVVEILDDQNQSVLPGESGRLVVTGFGNYATPLIRYDIGDRVIRSKEEKCSCGRSGLLLDQIIGRKEDYILTPDGRYVGRLDHLFKDVTTVKAAQLIQNSIDELIIRIVKDDSYTLKDEMAILQEARFRLGDSIKIKFEYVSEINRTRSGKLRFIVSNIPQKEIFGRNIALD